MKSINKPVKVMAIFYPDGKVEPVKFRLDDQVIFVQKIVKTHIEKSICPKRTFVCQHNGSVYELRFEPDTCIWYLLKK